MTFTPLSLRLSAWAWPCEPKPRTAQGFVFEHAEIGVFVGVDFCHEHSGFDW